MLSASHSDARTLLHCNSDASAPSHHMVDDTLSSYVHGITSTLAISLVLCTSELASTTHVLIQTLSLAWPACTITPFLVYSSVVSRDSVCIGFTLAALNDLNLLSVDIGNTCLQAETKEKV
jgi:hypothetical protein